MNTSSLSTTRAAQPTMSESAHVASRRFDWIMAALAAYFVGGLFLDGWAHTHGKVDQSFFTPWHAVLYSGQILMVIVLVGVLVRNVQRGSTMREALPRGYDLSLIGLLLWFIGGPGDLLWHTLFGIEVNVEALYSPTHLLLALGMILAVSGPLRAAYYRSGLEVRRLTDQLPAVLSLTFTLSVLMFFTMIGNPISNLWGTAIAHSGDEARGMLGIMVATTLLMGAVLLLVRQWKLSPGVLTVLFSLSAAAAGVLVSNSYPLVFVAMWALAGIIADALYWWLKPAVTQPNRLRVFAALVPAVIFALYFLAAGLTSRITWTTHLWVGSLVIAGACGILLSLLVAPPATPTTSST